MSFYRQLYNNNLDRTKFYKGFTFFFRTWVPCGFPCKPYVGICKAVYCWTRQDPRRVFLLFHSTCQKELAGQFWHLHHILNNSTLIFRTMLHLLKHNLCHFASWHFNVTSIPFPSSRLDKEAWIGNSPISRNCCRLSSKLLYPEP